MDVQHGATANAILAGAVAERIATMIAAGEAVWEQGALRPMRPGDVLALVRTRGPMFKELIKAFKRAQFPVAGADRMMLRDELAVEDCLALMRVALDPGDDLALACVLKGPWCNLLDDDAHLFPLAHGRARGETLMSRLMASRDENHGFARQFVEDVVGRGGDDAFSFLSWALETTFENGRSGWERIFSRLGPEARDPLEELLQRALKSSAHVSPTLQRFLHDIEIDEGQVKRELEAETGAVRVMTVHGAKGLEAPVVILADTTGDVADAPDNGLIFDDDAGPFVSFRKRDDDAAVRAARAAHEARMLREHWRLLYVAMTRARDRLIVCGPQFRHGESNDSWRRAVEEALTRLDAAACDTPFGQGFRLGASLKAAAQASSADITHELPEWTRRVAPNVETLEQAAPSRLTHSDASLFSPRGDGQRRFRRGRLIHGLLQRLPDVESKRRRQVGFEWLQRQGVAEKEAEEYANEAIKVIEDARFAAVFGSASRPEAPIVGVAGGRFVSGVVDRLAVDGDRVLVLDFKTDRPAPADAASAPEAYVLQLALYRDVLRAIFSGKTVACALLWTEAPRLMELPEARLDAALAALKRG
jgi:ATP-dependent helicase/nuclease subunit A